MAWPAQSDPGAHGTPRPSRSAAFCASLLVDAEVLLILVRGHWQEPSGRGNGLHRTLDVQSRGDDGRLRHAPALLALILA